MIFSLHSGVSQNDLGDIVDLVSQVVVPQASLDVCTNARMTVFLSAVVICIVLRVERVVNLILLLFTYFQQSFLPGGYNNMEYPSLPNDWQTLEVFLYNHIATYITIYIK